ncbi:MAG: YfiR/HmsC family protein [Saprospiraceae bacterium]|nr:YfiR/HmsC family protein [Saprospiraceae bacterium]
MTKKIIFFLIILIQSLSANAQKSFDDESRAIYILDISKYVKWENFDNIKVFEVGVLDSDNAVFNALVKEASNRITIQGKPIKIVQFKSIDEIHKTQVLFMNKRSNYDIDLTLNKIRGNNTLLISENYEFHKSMINFIVIDGRKRYELNLKKLESEGLSVSELFVASAVTIEADWEKLYEQTEKELEQEKLTVVKQKSQIEKQIEEIKQQQQQIAIQKLEIEKQKAELKELESEIDEKQQILNEKIKLLAIQKNEIEKQEQEIISKRKEIVRQYSILSKQKSEISKQERKINNQKKILSQYLVQLEKQKLIMYFFVVLFFLVSGLGYFIYRSYKIKKEANILLEIKNRRINKQKEEIEIQRDNISDQYERISAQKKQITDSIYYAQRIQRAILPNLEDFDEALDNFFILYKPKDIVSGDFYWETKHDDNIVVVAADCTGHGVPGAFMSMLGMTFLNDIVNREGIIKPSEILNLLRNNIIDSLHQSGENQMLYDGMDIAVCTINSKTNIIQFAGANNPMFIIRNKELIQFKGDNMPVAIHDNMVSFTNKEFQLKKNDCIYIFSDGYVDQFGGVQGKKFLRKRLKNTLIDLHSLSMANQKEKLDLIFEEWKNTHEQIDDVLIIGIKI